MYRKFQPIFIMTETPVHAGSGSELGIVDLPIQRERYTNFPKIEGSGIKGCIREAFEGSIEKIKLKVQKNAQEVEEEFQVKDKDLISLVFGPEDGDAHAGSIAFTDAKILLFPVKSLKGVFAWITCPMVLHRFIEDMEFAGKWDAKDEWDLRGVENTVPKQSNVLVSGKVVLEEFTFNVTERDEATKIAEKLSQFIFPSDSVYKYWRDKLKKDLVILSDEDFEQFVKTSTEVITRTKISSETGTVQSGALWTEEYLPQDTILYTIAMTTSVRVDENKVSKGPFKGKDSDEEAGKVMEFFKQGLPEIIHLGGNQTIGKGIVRVKYGRVAKMSEKETLINKLEKGRAEFAYKCAEDGKKIKEKTHIDGEWYKDDKYASYVKKIPQMILSNGLGQTLVFILSKRKK